MDKVEMGRSRGDMRVAVRATLALEGGLKAQLRRVRRLKAVLAAAASAEKVAMVADAVGSLIEPRLVEVLGMFPDADELQPAPPPAGLEVLEPSFRFQDTDRKSVV